MRNFYPNMIVKSCWEANQKDPSTDHLGIHLQYVLRAKGSRFSRKLFITAQLESLAIHYNLKLAELFQLFYEGIEELSKRQSSYNELYSIFARAEYDFKKDGLLKTSVRLWSRKFNSESKLYNWRGRKDAFIFCDWFRTNHQIKAMVQSVWEYWSHKK